MMKIRLRFLLLFVGFSLRALCQQVTLKDLDSTTLLSRLFGATEIKNDSVFGVIGGWKPNMMDSIDGLDKFAISDDKHLCYSKLDTILFYSEGDLKYAITAFEIIPPRGDGFYCHGCGSTAIIAKLRLEHDSINSSFWSVQYFNKNFLSGGQYGELGGKFSTKNLGNNHCLAYDFIGSYNGSGEETITYFSLENGFKEIFRFMPYHIRFGVPINDKEVDLEVSTKVKNLQNGIIQLTTKEEYGTFSKKFYKYDSSSKYYLPLQYNPQNIKHE